MALAGLTGVLRRQPKHNFDAAAPPTPQDNAARGYRRGSQWIMPARGVEWRLMAFDANGLARWSPRDSADIQPRRANTIYAAMPNPLAIGAAAAADLLYLQPFAAKGLMPWSQLGVRPTAGAAGAVGKFGIWVISEDTQQPVGLPQAWHNTGTAITPAGQALGALNANWVGTPGVQYAAGVLFGATVPTVLWNNGQNGWMAWALGGVLGNGGANHPQGWTTPVPYATDISTVDLTAAVLTPATGSTGVPAMTFRTAA